MLFTHCFNEMVYVYLKFQIHGSQNHTNPRPGRYFMRSSNQLSTLRQVRCNCLKFYFIGEVVEVERGKLRPWISSETIFVHKLKPHSVSSSPPPPVPPYKTVSNVF